VLSIFIMSAKRWCFTINNYTEVEYEYVWRALEDNCEYAVVGREVGEQGTKHLQGFGMFRIRSSLQTVKLLLHSRAHLEVARGTPRQNRVYCTKGGEYREHGECPDRSTSRGRAHLPGSPQSTCLARNAAVDEFITRMDEGRPGLVRFAEEQPVTWYFSGHNLLRNYLAVSSDLHRPDIRVEWYYGPPGVGKSRRAHEELPTAFIKDPRTKWWSGYLLEKECIIDDFAPGGIDMNHLLRWFDRYRCTVETKGGVVPLHVTHFIVTSNFHPSDCFKSQSYVCNNTGSSSYVEDHPQLPALMRRINVVLFE